MRSKQLATAVFLLLACSSLVHAQYENVWVFGGGKSAAPPNGAGLDFNNSNPPVAIKTSIYSMSGGAASASVCDRNGQLLFYTEGDNIWSRDGNLMPNGTNITQLGTNYPLMYNATVNTSQGALIVAMPDSANKYYVFSLSSAEAVMGAANAGKLFYSVVDMNLNGGMGDIVPGRKGILIDSALSEHMTAVAGDECNVWVMVMPLITQTAPGTASQFKAYEITESGLNTTPVVSPAMPYVASAMSRGTIAFSPNRQKMAVGQQNLYPDPGVSGTLALYDFNPKTGIVSNQMILDESTPVFLTSGYGGVCFSPDNSKLYAQYNGMPPFDPSGIFQFDLSKNDIDTIAQSKTMVTPVGWETHIKAGPNGKLYFFNYDHQVVPVGGDSLLGVINAPNLKGAACDVAYNAPISFLPGTTASIGLPNTVGVPRMIDTTYKKEHIIVCADEDSVSLQVAHTGTFWYEWSDSSTNANLNVSQSGTYWVRQGTYCHTWVDTFIVTKVNLDPLIRVDKFELSTTQAYDTYQWALNGNDIAGATNRTLQVTKNGDYTVTVSNDSVCSETSPIYKVTNAAISNPAAIAQEIKVYPNPARETIYIQTPVDVNLSLYSIEGKTIKQAQKVKQLSLHDVAAGIYLLQINDTDGRLLKVEKVVKRP